MSFHAATMESNRMQKLYSFLLAVKHKGATTMEINDACASTRASSDISELNRNGHETVCRLDHTTETGRRVHRFWLKEFATEENGDEVGTSGSLVRRDEPSNAQDSGRPVGSSLPMQAESQCEFFADVGRVPQGAGTP